MARKLNDPEIKAREVRDHPELPGCAELQQFLILDFEQEVEEEESLMEAMYKVADSGDDTSSSEDSDGEASEGESEKKKKKPAKKKNKRKAHQK